ncbi:MAG TPA: glycoside hydrolase family 95 protein [Tepidisphaeraceae bacterium]|nr:glycoside hydrolase family 95 protein [Tepidisphaeraceae bacterium]
MPSTHVLKFDAPAARWIEALPVGNGPLGGMVFGTWPAERIQVNEHTVWEGRASDRVNPTALTTLPEIRRLLFAGDYPQAEKLLEEHLIHPSNKRVLPYQPLCDLHVSTMTSRDAVGGYERSLDLIDGLHRVRYDIWGKVFERECFASLTDGVLVARFAYPEPTDVLMRLDRVRDVSGTHLLSSGLALDGRLGDDGVAFRAQVELRHDGQGLQPRGNALIAQNVRELTVLLAGATSFRMPDDLGADPAERCAAMLGRVADAGYEQLRDRHVTRHRELMGRVRLDITSGSDGSRQDVTKSTATRLAAFRGTAEAQPLWSERLRPVEGAPEDWAFMATVFQGCRYALIGSSMPGSQPSTLQGRWCGDLKPAWESDYHPNINLQMNYWLANATGLPECNEPLFDWLEQIARFGRRTARDLYGCDGWVLHHASDIFAATEPIAGPWGVWPVGGAWMCLHLWEHYRYTQDAVFLRERALPVMLEAARFMLDFLVEAPAGAPHAGRLVTNPSHSPENTFLTPDGRRAWCCVSATMDTQIVGQLFRDCLSALAEAGEHSPLRPQIEEALRRLPPTQISPRTGRLMEWLEDFEEPEPGHRHLSHLFALHPGDGVRRHAHPELIAAARKTIDWRLAHDYHATGWSLHWLACFFARVGDGDRALEMLVQRLADFTMPNVLFSNAHGAPQIADACGFAAAIAEMLLQSHDGCIDVLPALPSRWPAGHVTGLRARGGFEVDLSWDQGHATHVRIRSHAGNPCKVRTHGRVHDLLLARGEDRVLR